MNYINLYLHSLIFSIIILFKIKDKRIFIHLNLFIVMYESLLGTFTRSKWIELFCLFENVFV